MHIEIDDPFDAVSDPSMPFLSDALNPARVQTQFAQSLPALGGSNGTRAELHAIRVLRHKPGRRCLIEYELQPANGEAMFSVLGKARAKGLDEHTYRLTVKLWEGALGPSGTGGTRVPEPLGVVPSFQMWFQRKVPGMPAVQELTGPNGPGVGAAIADAIHHLHCAGVPARHRHTMADELRILHDRLGRVSVERPDWSSRIARLQDVCVRMATAAPVIAATGIHRDFYHDQVLLDEADNRRIYLIDLDLYSEGDPALDVGNFVAHLTEHALRMTGDPTSMAHCERAMIDRFAQLNELTGESGDRVQRAVTVYAALALARHVWISSSFPDRSFVTEQLIDLVQERIAMVA